MEELIRGYYLCAVMLMGTLVYKQRYSFPEYVCTLLVAGGVSIFALLKVRDRVHVCVCVYCLKSGTIMKLFFCFRQFSVCNLFSIILHTISECIQQFLLLFLCFCHACLGQFQTSSKTISKLARPNAPLGYGLCFLNLAFDGFTNATQDSIKARYDLKNNIILLQPFVYWLIFGYSQTHMNLNYTYYRIRLM